MAGARNPIVLLDLPAGTGRDVLRAGLMALRVVPTDLPSAPGARITALENLARDGAMAFVDISRADASIVPALAALDASLPRDATRRRIVLTRLASGSGMGHVSDADRRWVRRLGFLDLLPEFDARDCEGGLRSALDTVARSLELEPLAPAELARYARGMSKPRASSSPRAQIRSLCGMSAEGLCSLMQRSLNIAEWTFRLQRYPQCFVGSEAVAWLERQFRRSTSSAVAIGRAMMNLGLLVHVIHEQSFRNEFLFYRLAVSRAADRLDPGSELARLAGPEGPPSADRSYMMRSYPQCWVGSEAVDRLVAWHGIERHDAWVLLHRMMQFGLIEHVAHARPFIDGHFYYRFSDPIGR